MKSYSHFIILERELKRIEGMVNMNTTGEEAKEGLRSFVRGLNKEQADHIMNHLPKLIALIEEPMELSLQELFLQVG